MSRFSHRSSVLIVALAMMLMACENRPSNGIQIGAFVDSPVEGLIYQTETLYGLTNASGQFRYLPGETISFSVGNVSLGDPVAAKPVMTPLDLVPDARIYRTTAEVLEMFRDYGNDGEPSFRRLTNILVFLQTFDSDRDLSRIEISAGVRNLLGQAKIDFDMDIYQFQNDVTRGVWFGQNPLRYFSWLAARDGLIPTSSPQKPGAALDHLYRTLGIDTVFHVPGTTTTADSVTTTELNDEGRIAATRYYDTDAEGGSLQYVSRNVYDEFGNLRVSGTDLDDDGTIDRPIEYNFDEFGGPALTYGFQEYFVVTRDNEANQTIWHIWDAGDQTLTRRFNQHGQLAEVSRRDEETPTSLMTWAYDVDGTPTSSRLEYRSAEGALQHVVETFYTERGRPSWTSYDGWTVDLATRSFVDAPLDGIVDTMIFVDYDSDGREVGSRIFWPDTGEMFIAVIREYDSAGRWTRIDSPGFSLYTRSYDGDGVLQEEFRSCLYCQSDRWRRLSYDAASRTTRISEEWSEPTWVFRAPPEDFQLITTAETILIYDDAGALVSMQRDLQSDGSVDDFREIVNQAGTWSSLLDGGSPGSDSYTTPEYYE